MKFTTKFSSRSDEEEIMDDLNSSGEVIDQTLYELDEINRKLGGNHVTIDGIKRLLLKNPPFRKLAIVDIGCGGGDILIEIAKWANKRRLDFELIGIDANPNIIEFARKNASSYPQIRFEVLNIFSQDFRNQSYDIIISSLFTHHFKDEDLISLFASLKKQTKIGVVINDLHRHWLAYYSIKLIVNVLSKSPMVQHDGPVSVLRAFKKKEIKNILKRAGIHQYSIRWMWAFRFQIIF